VEVHPISHVSEAPVSGQEQYVSPSHKLRFVCAQRDFQAIGFGSLMISPTHGAVPRYYRLNGTKVAPNVNP
jgi:hypothetical protein